MTTVNTGGRFASFPDDLRNPNVAKGLLSQQGADFVQSGAGVDRAAVGVEPPGRFDAMKQRLSPQGVTNAAAGATSQAGVPGGAQNPVGAQANGGQAAVAADAGGASRASGVPGGNAGVGLRERLTGGLQAAKNFVTNPGASGAPIQETLRSAAGGTVDAVKSGASMAKSIVTNPFAVASAGIVGGYQGLNTDTEQYAKRFGLENTEPGVLRDVGVRSLGVASDVGNNMLLGVPQMLGMFRDKDGTTSQAPADYNAPTGGSANPYGAANDAKLAAATSGQRVARDMPGASGEALRGRFGDYSPAGTFAPGWTDLGGGIAGQGKGLRGQPNSFTNIGADGKPTAISGMDTRTPDQIANGNRIRAETAKTVAAAGGLANLERSNALTAANLRDGVDPRRGMSGPENITMNVRRINERGPAPGNDGRSHRQRSRDRLMDLEEQRNRLTADSQLRADATQRRGQDIQLETAALPQRLQLEAAQRMRQMNAELWQRSGGDPAVAQMLAMSAGLDGKPYGDMVSTAQAQDAAGRKQTRDLLAPASTATDKDGNPVINEAMQAQNEALVRQMTGAAYDAMSPEQKTAAAQRVLPALNIIKAANARKDVGWKKSLGYDVPDFPTETLPEFAGNAEEVGWFEGMVTPGLERGDLQAPLKGGGMQSLRRKDLTKSEIEALKANGARFLRDGAN